AGDAGRHTDLCAFAGEGVVEGNLEVIAQVGTALAARSGAAAAPAAHELAEQIVENVRHGGGEIRAEPVPAAAHAATFERGVPELIVGSALLRILERLVGFVQLFETVLRRLVARPAVGVAFLGETAEGGLDVLLAGVPGNPEDIVVVALGH